MPELSIAVTDAKIITFAAAPSIAFRLNVTNDVAEQRIHTVVLRAQLQLEVTRRHYAPEEEEKLRDLFGEKSRWGQTLKPMLWTHANAVVPPFAGSTVVELHVPCTFDFNVGATKYFYGVTEGEVPINFLFSGSVFYQDEGGQLQVAPISWTLEARYRLPASTWHALMSHYYPNSAWLNLPRESFDRLYRFKVQEGIPTWGEVLDRVLPASIEIESGSDA